MSRDSAGVGEDTGRRARAGDETRKQQIARRLRMSEQALEQYFQSKLAELEDEVELDFVHGRHEHPLREKRI